VPTSSLDNDRNNDDVGRPCLGHTLGNCLHGGRFVCASQASLTQHLLMLVMSCLEVLCFDFNSLHIS
jgi:hypothetical protein